MNGSSQHALPVQNDATALATALGLPARARVSRCAGAVERDLRAWASHEGLVRGDQARCRFDASRYSLRVTAGMPDAPHEELLLCSQFLAWAFLVDDLRDEGPREAAGAWSLFAGRVASVTRTGHAGIPYPSAQIAALERLWARATSTSADTGWCRRFGTHLSGLAVSGADEARYLQRRVSPSVQEYVRLRRATLARFGLDLMQRGTGAVIPEPAYRSPGLDALLTAMVDLLGWANDLVSLPKEMARGGAVNNLVVVIARARETDLETAARCARQMLISRHGQYRELERRFLADANAGTGLTHEMRACICQGLRDWLTGYLAWHAVSARYRTATPGAACRQPILESGW